MPDQIVNLSFHGIGRPVGRDFGAGEREMWVRPDRFAAALDACAERDDVTLSFDDGNWSDLELALPELRRRELSATFFLVPGWLGEPGFLGRRDVRQLVAAGMAIGNHGLQHHDWTQLSLDRLEHEVGQGRRLLEELAGAEVRSVAVPYGAYNDLVLDSLRRQGYDAVYTSDGGTATPGAWLQPREHARADQEETGVRDLFARLLGS